VRTILRVDMSTLTITKEPIPERWVDFGGRALTSAIVFEEVPADSDPLGPANKLVFAPGLLGGTTAPNGGRLSIGAKSPLTGGIKESNSGGQLAHALGHLGFAAIVVEGAAKEGLYSLIIESDGSAKLERTDAWAKLGKSKATR